MNSVTTKERAGEMFGVSGRFFNVARADNGRILNQTFKATRYYSEGKNKYAITVCVRFDDECKNGHETFAITADIRENGREYMGGCCHDEIAKHFPELACLIQWHLMSTDGPLHYVANTLYWLGYSGWTDGKHNSPPNIEHARSTAVWPNMPESMLAPSLPDDLERKAKLKTAAAPVQYQLEARLDGLLIAFRDAMISAGLEYPETATA